MELIRKIRQIERIDQLIRLKATGSPKELAKRINISLRQIHRLLNEMKLLGLPIRYCKQRKTYYYTSTVKFCFVIKVSENCLIEVNRGLLK